MKDSSTGKNPKYEVADIFRRYGEEYRSQNGMSKKQRQVMNAIMICRTSECGCHIDMCDKCGYTDEAYNSCRDRHCPKCQGINRRKWVNARLEDILPVAYYHVVFTLPHLINPILSYNRAFIYNLLFSASSETLLALGRNPKWLGGEMGFYGVLHTWGQTLSQHAHVHYIVPAGGLTKDGEWLEPKNPDTFLFPVEALSAVFRGKFIDGLKAAHHNGQLDLPDDLSDLSCDEAFENWLDDFVGRNWVVYCKPPFGSAEQVVKYIGRYTHRVAISNSRITDIDAGLIRFRYKDYTANETHWREMVLSAREFIHRFLCHVLPKGFHKIRHYGYLANGRCRTSISMIKRLLCRKSQSHEAMNEDNARIRCPECGKGLMFPMIMKDRLGRIIISALALIRFRAAYDTS